MTVHQVAPAELAGQELAAERNRAHRGGFIIFLISESMFFLPLLASRFVLAGSGHPADLDQVLAGGLTVVMLAGLIPVVAMGQAAARGEWGAVQRWAGLAVVIGVTLLAGIGWEWHSSAPDSLSRYGGSYDLTVGMHALHLFIAVVLLLGVMGRARAGRFTSGSHVGVTAGQLFWYLVTGLWLAVWVVFYLA